VQRVESTLTRSAISNPSEPSFLIKLRRGHREPPAYALRMSELTQSADGKQFAEVTKGHVCTWHVLTVWRGDRLLPLL
jgi:hypothetical protein